MHTNHGIQMALCGGASIVLALGACAVQAQETNQSTSRVIVTQPTQARGMMRVVSRNNPPDEENQEIRIERHVVDGKEQVQLWINGKQIDVDNMADVQKALGEHGDDIEIQAFGDAEDGDGHGTFYHIVTPGGESLHGAGVHEFNLSGPKQFQFPKINSSGTYVFNQPKSMLGVQLAPISDDLRDYLGLEADTGVRVDHVVDDSPAAKAGLKEKDIIIAAKIGSESHDPIGTDDLRKAISQAEPGTNVTLTVLRHGKKEQITATLTKWDGDNLGMTILPEGQLELATPEILDGRQLELQALPQVRQRLLEIKPQLHEMNKALKDAMPDRQELLKSMEQQMKQMQEMLDQLREQQKQLHQQIEKSGTPEA